MEILIELRRECFIMLVHSIEGTVMRSKGNVKRIKGNTEYNESKGNKAFTGQVIWRHTSYNTESSWHGAVKEQSWSSSSFIHIILRNTADYPRYPKKRETMEKAAWNSSYRQVAARQTKHVAH